MKKAAKKVLDDLKKTKGKKPARRATKNLAMEDREPPARELAWYYEWAVNHRRQADIAREAKVSRPIIHRAVHAVHEWLRQQTIDDILVDRMRQSETLEQAAAVCLKKFYATLEVPYMEEARKILADIRKMKGVDKPEKLEIETDSDGLARAAGMSRADAMRAMAAVLMKNAESADSAEGSADVAAGARAEGAASPNGKPS